MNFLLSNAPRRRRGDEFTGQETHATKTVQRHDRVMQEPRPEVSAHPVNTERTNWRGLQRIPARVLIGLVRVYQWTLSPIIGRQCRFNPTCSNYFIQAVEKYGAVRGSWRGLWRILRCHPLHPGGNDPA